MAEPQPQTTDRGGSAGATAARSAWVAGGGGAGVVLVVLLGVMALGGRSTRAAFDEVFHANTIRQFETEWPRPDFREYDSATTPGYHLIMAGVSRAAGGSAAGSTGAMRVLGAIFAAALAGLVAGMAAARVGVAGGVALAAPLAGSMYVVNSGVHLLPDNLAWLGVAGVLGLALRRFSWGAVAAAAGVVAALVLVRQVHVWTAGVVWAAAGISAATALGPGRGWPFADGAELRRGIARGAVAAALTLPAFVVLGYFARLWGGLTPPKFNFDQGAAGITLETNVVGVSPATPAYVLALVGVLGVFFAPFFLGVARGGRWWRWAAGGAVAGACLALVPETTYRMPERIGSLWSVVRVMEGWGLMIGGRTAPLIVVLAACGGAVLAGWWPLADRRARWILGTALLAFTLANTAQALVYQRYLEPFVLLWLALAAACGPERSDGAEGRRASRPRWAGAGPGGLAIMLWGLSGWVLATSPAPEVVPAANAGEGKEPPVNLASPP